MGNDHEATCPSPSDLLERPNGKNSTVLSSPLTWLLYQLRLVSNELVTSFELASGTSGLVGSRQRPILECSLGVVAYAEAPVARGLPVPGAELGPLERLHGIGRDSTVRHRRAATAAGRLAPCTTREQGHFRFDPGR